MVPAKTKSNTFAQIKKKAPGGRQITHFRKRRPRQAVCAVCGTKLHGVPRLHPAEARNTPKTMKRPERAYGGVLCASCLKVKILTEKILL
ncbi:MAG: 50S ribosomal protein L34e [Candidatus Woesearchaeota archaeon]|nr:MAG: 50S ribosomal protein L34e [Candidatus Woesearchaeota archaeon]